MLPIVVELLTTLLALAGLGFTLVALWSARSWSRQQRAVLPSYAPPVSILKPVKGLDHEMYAAFASHCEQDYSGDYEILFGVSSLQDAAVSAVRQLQQQYPERAIRLILCPEILGTNGKVSNLTQMLPEARFDHILVNDSDIKVSRRYLSRVMACFATPRQRVGMVTAPYRGQAHATLWSKMEALGIATDFFPGVLTALKLEKGIRFGLGSTLAMTQEALDAIGGFFPLADSLSDDYELGARIAAAGYDVALCAEVVETWLPPYGFRAFVDHQLRWLRSMRDSRKAGYAGLIFTFALPWALLNVVASGASAESVALLSIVLTARVSLALAVGVGLLGDTQVLRDFWMLPLRDLCAMALWVWSYASDTILWRGERFTLRKGRLIRKA